MTPPDFMQPMYKPWPPRRFSRISINPSDRHKQEQTLKCSFKLIAKKI